MCLWFCPSKEKFCQHSDTVRVYLNYPSSGHYRTCSWKQFSTAHRISLIAGVWDPVKALQEPWAGGMWSEITSETNSRNSDILCSTPDINLLFSLPVWVMRKTPAWNMEQTPAARAHQRQHKHTMQRMKVQGQITLCIMNAGTVRILLWIQSSSRTWSYCRSLLEHWWLLWKQHEPSSKTKSIGRSEAWWDRWSYVLCMKKLLYLHDRLTLNKYKCWLIENVVLCI